MTTWADSVFAECPSCKLPLNHCSCKKMLSGRGKPKPPSDEQESAIIGLAGILKREDPDADPKDPGITY